MINVTAMLGGLANSGNPEKLLGKLNDEELGEMHDDADDSRMLELIEEEMRRRAGASKKSWTGAIVWLLVIAMLVGSIAAVVM